MKAVSPVRPQNKSAVGCSELALRCLSEHSLATARCKMEEESLCLQYDMNDCYTRLKRLVPTIPPNKKVSKVEILQHVIDYILDLQLALETHPVLLRQQGSCPSATPRTPLTAINTDPAASVIKKQGDSIMCR
ncbi:DNA-binding protein inhibitor ID-4 [Latimeria chalumnae]|uniref:DNA-binding protein inhibitor ID-4 n=1 Tax=Latimeria chalumnae TaxID=7897 RepID=H3ADB9_LATCH|nr:PREDICTED: DNA-binding protein inhibitor ID-4 [Latimeria chalumnae]|eukprot:XP_006011407.1 PREDICTED: DNA-binding protein inhibitor ID-4 [Latimeria chalumnae]